MAVPAMRGASKAVKEIAQAGAKDKKLAAEAAGKVMPEMPKINTDWVSPCESAVSCTARGLTNPGPDLPSCPSLT